MIARVFCNDNGFGLSRDFAVVRPILEACGYTVERIAPSRPAKGRADISIHLEHIYPKNLGQSRADIAVPNVEWCPGTMVTAMRRCQVVCAKTMDAADILARQGLSPIMTGWTSPDIYREIPRYKRMIHLAGRSPLKSTHTLIQAMALIPDIPLTIYRPTGLHNLPANVSHTRAILTPDAVIEAQNEALIHVLPSQYEGFGHAINEAACVGANIVTTNHAPMNTFGAKYLCPVMSYKRQNLASLAIITPQHLAQTIRQAWEEVAAPDPEARKEWQRRDEAFNLTFTEVIRTI